MARRVELTGLNPACRRQDAMVGRTRQRSAVLKRDLDTRLSARRDHGFQFSCAYAGRLLRPAIDLLPRKELLDGTGDAVRERDRRAGPEAESLVQIEVADVAADGGRAGQPHLRVQVGAVHVDLPAV